MSTLELIKTQNEHKACTFFEHGEDMKSDLKKRYESTETPEMVTNPRDYIRQTTDYKMLIDALFGSIVQTLIQE